VSERFEPAAGVGQPDPGQESLGRLVKEIAGDLSDLVRDEMALARAELKQEAAKGGKAAGMLGGAGLAGWMVALFVSLAAAWGLDAVMPPGWAALVVAAVWALIGAVLYQQGRDRLKRVDPRPEQTIQTVKEDVQWARSRKS
jgi:hypothetical protein